MSDVRGSGGRLRHSDLGIFLLALLVRGLYLWQLSDSTLFEVLLGDGRQYHAWAVEIASGQWLGSEVFYQAPLYPYFMAVVFAAFAASAGAVRTVQILLGAASCAFVSMAGRRFFSPRVGLLAGVVLALYPPAIFFDGLIQKTSLGLFFTTFLLLLLSVRGPRMRWWRLFLMGTVLGCLALTRENALIVIPVVALWVVVQVEEGRWSRPVVRLAWFALGVALVLGPVGLRNYALGGRFQMTTSQLGPNFFIGNNPDADGKYRPLRPGREDARVERQDAKDLAEAELGRSLGPAEVSRYWLRRSLSYVRSEPGDWARLLARKALMAVNARELVDTESLEAYREISRLLRWLGFLHFGVIAPLAVLGIWATRRQWRRLWILHAVALAVLASVVLFYVLARYRFPLVPIAVMFAAAGLVDLGERLRGAGLASAARGLAVVGLAAVVCNWPLGTRTSPLATTYYNLGTALFELGDDARAADYLERALALHPEVADSHYSLGRVLEAQGKLAEAAVRYEEALRLAPGHASAHGNLGHLLMQAGDLDAAERHLRQSVALEPAQALSHNLLGNLLAHRGRREEAASAYRRALEIDPGLADARFKLGVLLLELNEPGAARPHLEEAVRQLPAFAEAHLQLATALGRLGEVEAAIREYRRVLELRPGDATAAAALATLEAARGGAF